MGHAVVHGTFDGYNNHGCRCDQCRTAGIEYQRGHARAECLGGCGAMVWIHYWGATGICRECKKKQRQPKHGTLGEYRRGCRCDDCRNVSNAARRRYRFLHPDQAADENARRMERYYARKRAA